MNSTQGELSLTFKAKIDCSVDERWQTRSLNSRWHVSHLEEVADLFGEHGNIRSISKHCSVGCPTPSKKTHQIQSSLWIKIHNLWIKILVLSTRWLKRLFWLLCQQLNNPNINLQQDELPFFWSEKVVGKLEKLLVCHLLPSHRQCVVLWIKITLFVLDDSKMYP